MRRRVAIRHSFGRKKGVKQMHRSIRAFFLISSAALLVGGSIPLPAHAAGGDATVGAVFDISGALVLMLVSSVLLIPIAVLIKLTSPGPIFFRQQRSGLNGRPFTLYKFRTMVTNAEQFQHELAAMNEMTGPVFKVTNDPRVTPVGKFLRKYSLDEFPQLFNVLPCKMSISGPGHIPCTECDVSRTESAHSPQRGSVQSFSHI